MLNSASKGKDLKLTAFLYRRKNGTGLIAWFILSRLICFIRKIPPLNADEGSRIARLLILAIIFIVKQTFD